eukprot:s2847_g3.t1
MPKTVPVRFVIIGSGGSSSLPNLRHVLQKEAGCKVCHEAWENPDSKNRRGNPCLLVTVRDPASEPQHLLVDCGKTFEEAPAVWSLSNMFYRRKFRSQTSDNLDRWKSQDGKRHGREKLRQEKVRREKIRQEKVRREKIQVREKVRKSRNTVSFQCFMVPEGRNVGSLKRRVRSHLGR